MKETISKPGRRNFIKKATALTTGLTGIALLPQSGWAMDKSPEDNIHIIGPKEGFSPQIGTLVSMMNWMRVTVMGSVKNMTKEELDYLHDPKSNTIGAMLLHLVATEVFYTANTFEGRQDYNEAEKSKWGPAMSLGDEGRKKIKGNGLDYYLNILKETREINFMGNVEGRDLFNDKADVIVCDGFTGNVILKMAESFYDISIKRNIDDDYINRFHYENYGGTPVLGVAKPVIIGHGISKAKSFTNMILLAEKMITSNVIVEMVERFKEVEVL